MKNSTKLTSLLASTVLVTTIITPGISVFAEESNDNGLIITETLGNGNAAEGKIEDVTGNEIVKEDAGLIPGDFFYFVEVMQEKIQLALTMDEYKKSELLAKYASERIAEANELIKEEKYDEAGELLKLALDSQGKAEEEISGNKEETSTEDTESAVEESNIEKEEEHSTEDKVGEETSDQDTSIDSEKIKVKLANNIDALSIVLAKIENPKAQAAIMKNIEKSFAKLAKKIEKRANKLAAKENNKELDENGTINEEQPTVDENGEALETTTTVEAPVTDKALDFTKDSKKPAVENTEKPVKDSAVTNVAKEQNKTAQSVKANQKVEKAKEKAEKHANKGKNVNGNNGNHINNGNHGNGKNK
ncbi:DUF5667 domain-containing protein [Ornithinibacillus bavariensis]|uniref:DUF5667 domain-containing protein n=1 Tax=Ornithinibacillus bavariensis TaxID=545502 RepID=A0A920C7Q3_9BACI|nr:DUF5667 domain-containing protein [Ornithinibacillus bavariensis]GIO27913.1 hypothetical protein J43TS3_25240 [Ornithinibacillus bavariensis]